MSTTARKKKILFAINELNVGGVEKSLLSLLDAIPREHYEIHLATMQPGGGFEKMLPADVTVHRIGGYMRIRDFMRNRRRGIVAGLKAGRIGSTLSMLASYTRAKLSGGLLPFFDHALRGEMAAGGMEFDLAVNYAGPSEFLDCYVTRHVRARHRAAWIHFDLERTFDRLSTTRRTHGAYERVFCVSEHALEVYRRRYPEFADHAELFHNIVDAKAIRRSAAETAEGYEPAAPPALNIATVARLNPEKGIELALRALAELHSRGIAARWHFVGGGESKERYAALAAALGLQEHVRFYGARTNPYPFMAAADVYVQPSLHEGFGITVAEALCLDAPIATTPFDCAFGQLSGGSSQSAAIASAFEAGALADAIAAAAAMPRRQHSPADGPDPAAAKDLCKLFDLTK